MSEKSTCPREQFLKRIESDFTYHKPDVSQITDMKEIRKACLELAVLIVKEVPTGREQASALTRLEEVMMHANAGIVRSCPIDVS